MNPLITQYRLLPEVRLDQPPESWIHAEGLQGPFGITAAVADFAEVLDWQEKRRGLTHGYYRLIHPPRVQRFKARLEARYAGMTAVLFASGPLAAAEVRDLQELRGRMEPVQVHTDLPETLSGGWHVLDFSDAESGMLMGAALIADAGFAAELHERNRRRGGALSARNVARVFGEPEAHEADPAVREAVSGRICELCGADHAVFYPSGMAAVTAVLEQFLTQERPRMLVMGNVYRDTHMLLEEIPWAGRPVTADILDTHDLDGLRDRAGQPDVAGVFLETVTNPLIEIPNLPEIIAVAKAAGIPVLVDNTMATPLNCRPLELGADVVVHSTSKYLSGNNAHGGGVVLTRNAETARAFDARADALGLGLSPLEFPGLWNGLETFCERMARFNRNGQALARMLREHPAVDAVYFGEEDLPDWLEGLGSVVSCELKEKSQAALAQVFDAPMAPVVKAPSLGSDVTLFCPYVLLTYYDKSDAYLEDCHLPRHLLRFAVGSEADFAPVLDAVRGALDRVTPG